MSEAALFDDGKDAGALRTIGEVAQALGIRQHVLRYWEEQFPQLKPVKRSGGRRYYRPEDVALVQKIDQLVHAQGFTLKGARQVLSAPAGQAPAPVAQPVLQSEANPALLFKLTAIRDRLAASLQN